MPKSRTRRSSSPRRRRSKADWVYRPNVRDEAGGLIDDLGTYAATVQTLLSGDGNANAAVLYDSHNRISAVYAQAGVNNLPALFPSATRAEGHKPLIVLVEGVHFVVPSTWALGSTFKLGLRFGIFEQDAATGAFLIDPLYAMWTDPANMAVSPAMWANNRNWQREFRRYEAFLENRTTFNYRFRFRVNRRLKPHECYGIYIATDTVSVTTQHYLWYRTLVEDEAG